MTGSPEAVWREALARGEFILQRSRSSGNVIFPPRMMEPRTGDPDLERVTASGMGTIYSVTIVNQKPPAESYNVVLVDLDEGARLMSRVEGVAAADVRIGGRVRARVSTDDEGSPLLLFDPA